MSSSMSLLLVGCLFLAGSCRHSSTPPEESSRVTTAKPVSLVPHAPTAEAQPAYLDRLKQVTPAPTAGSAPPRGRALGGAHPPLLPGEPGSTRAVFAGCLTSTTRGESDGETFPAASKALTRGPVAPKVSVQVAGSGILVLHDLDHACCLTAKVESSREGQIVRIVEKLSGEPCRCMCQSTIRTAVGLAPGAYQVVLEVIEQGRTREVHRQAVEIEHL